MTTAPAETTDPARARPFTKIDNAETLLGHGDRDSRRVVLDVADATLRRLDAYARIRSIARMEGSVLRVGERSWDLDTFRHVYLIGSGKACNHMAMAIEDVLGEHLTGGIVIVKIAETTDTLVRTEVHVGGHPIPNEAGYRASLKILELVDSCGPDDLVIGVISGGSSALMSCPIDGITLQDEMVATDVLLKSGAGIYEINAIRRHISRMNGGRLAQRIQATGAEFIGFGISDAVGNAPTGDIGVPYAAYASTPIGPDRTTLEDARRCIRDHDLAERLPRAIVDHLMHADDSHETPKAFPDNTYYLLNTVPDACRYAREAAEDLGVPAVVLTSSLEGEAKDAGAFLAGIAREITTFEGPFPPPCLIIAAGEVTTTILEDAVITGRGGPGQELAIGFALHAAAAPGACVLSIDTEGTDGTTPAAGGLCDSTTAASAVAAGIDLRQALRGHATFEALEAMGDAVITGNTGTNLCDLHLIYVPGPAR